MKIKKLSSLFHFLVFSFLVLSFFPITAARFLFRGDVLSVKDDSDFITSPENTFTCGFYSISGNNAYYFAIWVTNSRDKTMVWNAKQDRPVNRKGSKLTLRENGAMVLTDVDDRIVWQTNTKSSNIERAELLETGNLVLMDSKGDVLWQSFDNPTDTLLANQLFTKNHRLVPPLRKGSFSPGYFSFYFDSDNVLRMIYDGPQVSSIYWPNPEWDVYRNGRTSQNSSRLAYFDELGSFFSSDRMRFNVSDMGLRILRRMTMDIDGNLRIYSLDNSTGLWTVSWQAIAQPCIVHGICGRNAICTYGPQPKCSCPPGYRMVNESDWSRGCNPTFDPKRLNSLNVKFLEIPNVDYWGFDLNATTSMSLEGCRKICLDDLRCHAFGYRRNGEATCYTKGILFNGYRSPGFPGSIFLKVPMNSSESTDSSLLILEGTKAKCGFSPEETLYGSPSMYEMDFKKVRWLYLRLFCFTIGGIEILFVVLGWWALFSKHGIPASIEDGYQMVSSQFRRFTYSELKKATKNFKIELGRGGSGAVYKGVLADRRVVAVKRLAHEFQGDEEFWAEMSTVGKINHMNLVRMWGFCSEGRHRLLVYEFIENSSLDKHLYNSNLLGWKQRFAVALGTAKGLAYLHHECLEWVIHCDVKPENILLDGELEPKIADFGLAKLSQRGGAGSNFTKIRGTKGYMAPEWALNQPITAKVDVYGYGIVILEIVKGSRLSSWVVDDGGHDQEQESELRKFVKMVKRKIQSGEESWADEIVDPSLEGKFSKNQASTLIKVGLSCVEQDRSKRPTMGSVVQTLLDCEDETT